MILKNIISLIFVSFAANSSAVSTTRIVRNDVELQSALRSYRDINLLLVAPGNYERLAINGIAAAGGLEIRAQNASDRPEFKYLSIAGSSGIKLGDVIVSRPRAAPEMVYSRLSQIISSSNIRLNNVYFHGSLDGVPSNDMNGVYIGGSTSVSITNSKFEENIVAMIVDKSSAISIDASEFVHMARDSIDLAGSRDITIANSIMHGFIITPGEHPDGIQAWTSNQASGVQDVKIINNLILGDPAGRVQGIFLGDERALWKQGIGHRDIRIEGNIIAFPLWHGIYLDNAQNARLTQNRVLNGPGGPLVPGGPVFPWISVASGTALERNEAPRYIIGGKLVAPPATNKALGNRDMSKAIEKAAAQWRAQHGRVGDGAAHSGKAPPTN